MKRTVPAVLAAFAVSALAGCGSSSAPAEAAALPTEAQIDPEQLMFDTCVEAVTERLRAPATAVFPEYDTARYESPDPSGYHDIRVYGYVDSQNGFGALIRSDWSCSVSMSSDNKQVEDFGRLVVDGQPYSD
jgi:hypothetical protein